MVVVYGTVCVDRIRQVDRLPAKGGYAEILDEHVALGGEAANTASALKCWGAEVDLSCNPIGKGADSEFILSEMARRNLSTHRIPENGASTPYCDIYVTPDGERTMFGRGFAGMENSTSPNVFPLSSGDWFTTDPNHGRTARDAAVRAYEAGMHVYLLDFFQPHDPIFPGSYWQSSTDWVGQRGNIQKNMVWLRDWITAHACTAVLSDGPNGFVAGSPGSPVRAYPPFPCPEMVDSTGAGDAFRAGMLFGLDAGKAWADCLRIASAAGSLNCRGYGGSDAMPKMEEILALVRAHPVVAGTYD